MDLEAYDRISIPAPSPLSDSRQCPGLFHLPVTIWASSAMVGCIAPFSKPVLLN